MTNIKGSLLILSVALSSLFLGSCATSSLSVQVLKPADITIPQRIQNVVVINRSLPADDQLVGNIIEGILSQEELFADREGSDNCVKGLVELLISSPRYTANLHQDDKLRGTGTDRFPVSLDWGIVDQICRKYKAQAVISLESFDSDFVYRGKVERKYKTVDGRKIEYNEFVENMDVFINAGWRIYDAKQRRIIDENVYREFQSWTGHGRSKEEALSKLPIRRLAVRDAGYFAGKQYGFRISPVWVSVPRSYYIKGHDDFKTAKYSVKVKNWDKAAEIWQNNVNDLDPKVAARAMFNMALACEVQGKLREAQEWAAKSYETYPKNSAREYANKLNNRIYEQKRLQEQLGD